MTYQDLLRIAVIVLTLASAAYVIAQLWRWHRAPDEFDLRDLFMTMGRDKKQHVSRPAVGELVALFATTSGYLGVLSVRPQDYETATLIYGTLWAGRGAFSTYLRSKQK